jgi:hypothetical protein
LNVASDASLPVLRILSEEGNICASYGLVTDQSQDEFFTGKTDAHRYKNPRSPVPFDVVLKNTILLRFQSHPIQ